MLARVHAQRKEQESRLQERFDQLTQTAPGASSSPHGALPTPASVSPSLLRGRGPALQRTRGVKNGLQFAPQVSEADTSDVIPGYSSGPLLRGKAAQRQEPISYGELPPTNGPDAIDLSIPINYGEL